jgi:hypothetical protein
MSEHTPGEWRAHNVHVAAHDVGTLEKDGYNDHCIVEAADGRDLKEAQANARLIAAAPDLLEACKLMIGYGPGKMPDGRDTDDVLRAAAAKAEGRDE